MSKQEQQPPRKVANEPAPKPRRPYRKPVVTTGPLFEQMALACNDKDLAHDQS